MATATTGRATNLKEDTDTYFGKPRSQMDDMERETEEGLRKFIRFWNSIIIFLILDDIHQGVTRLKMLALHMNQELDNQKPLIDRLDKKIGDLGNDVNSKNKHMKEVLLR